MTNDRIIACGVDPGFASMGLAVVEWVDDHFVCRRLQIVETKKADKKTMRKIRVADDDQRRLKLFWAAVNGLCHEFNLTAIGIEGWRPFPGQMGGNAWKVTMAVQTAVCAGWHNQVPPMMFLPSDLKRRFLGSQKGSKLEIEYAVLQEVEGLSEHLEMIPRSKHEHVCDAACLAILAIESSKAFAQVL